MLIEIQCPNSTSKGMCGAKYIVPSEKVGEFVKCSRCKQRIEVATNKRKSSATSKSKSSKPKKKKARFRTEEEIEQIKKAKKKREVEALEKVEVPADALRGIRLPAQHDYSNAKSKKPDPYQDRLDRENEEEERPTRKEPTEKCSQCGSGINFGYCPDCKHVEPKYIRLYQPIDEMEIRTTGFQRWFTRSMDDEGTIKSIVMVSHVLFGCVMAIVVLFGVLATMEHPIATQWKTTKDIGIGILVGVFLLIIFYCLWVRKGYEFQRSATARLNWTQRPFWNFVLTLARILRWQGYDSRLKGRTIIKVRDRGFGDNDLLALPDLKTCEVLDLQKTQVTDEALKHLYGHRSLVCLVVRKTPVSHEAVFRLQQAMPRLWVWK